MDGVGQLVGHEHGVRPDLDGIVGLAADGDRGEDAAAGQIHGDEPIVGLLGDEQGPIRPSEEQVTGRAAHREDPLGGRVG